MRLLLVLALSAQTSVAWSASKSPEDIDLPGVGAAMVAGDFTLAHSILMPHAETSGLAQFYLGNMAAQGWGAAVDAREACRWFEKSAAHKIPGGRHAYADCLRKGVLGPPDPAAALALYLTAGEGPHRISHCAAADMLIRGEGVPKDVAQGLELCAKVAIENSPPAMMQMARYFSADPDVPPNLAVARQWFGMAAERGVNEARYEYASMLAEGRGGDPDLGHALPIMEQAASEGYLPAYLPTAILYGNLPVDAKTGALAPEHLAKVYLWASAARARLIDAEKIQRADQILTAVRSVMPKEWQPELDRRVTEHVTKYK